MLVSYDDDVRVDILSVSSAVSDGSYELECDRGVVVHLANDEGREIVGFFIMGASHYLPLGKKGYDAKTDTLMLGKITDSPEFITQSGDFIGYWGPDPDFPDEPNVPIGVALKRASVHLAEVSAQIAGVPA